MTQKLPTYDDLNVNVPPVTKGFEAIYESDDLPDTINLKGGGVAEKPNLTELVNDYVAQKILRPDRGDKMEHKGKGIVISFRKFERGVAFVDALESIFKK